VLDGQPGTEIRTDVKAFKLSDNFVGQTMWGSSVRKPFRFFLFPLAYSQVTGHQGSTFICLSSSGVPAPAHEHAMPGVRGVSMRQRPHHRTEDPVSVSDRVYRRRRGYNRVLNMFGDSGRCRREKSGCGGRGKSVAMRVPGY
jgi:hypothetical protein